jgi:hypothetical protein
MLSLTEFFPNYDSYDHRHLQFDEPAHEHEVLSSYSNRFHVQTDGRSSVHSGRKLAPDDWHGCHCGRVWVVLRFDSGIRVRGLSGRPGTWLFNHDLQQVRCGYRHVHHILLDRPANRVREGVPLDSGYSLLWVLRFP